MANEVRIKLTDEQKAKIKEATGKDLPEIRVESFGSAPTVSGHAATPRAGTKAPLKAGMKAPLKAGAKAPLKANF
jgi:hypothetical protein